MGCCFSTATATAIATKSPPLKAEPNYQNAPTHRRHEPTSHVLAPKQRDPPPVVDQEESVKEVVLSETLVSKPAQTATATTTQESVEQILVVPEEKGNVHLANSNKKLKIQEERREISEVSLESESCEREVSESFSYASLSTATTATTTVTEVRDDNDEAVSKRKRDSGAGPRRAAAAAATGGSPSTVARRKRPTPPELSTLRGRGHLTPAAERRRVGARAAGVRRDIGEVSARRSRSPATGRAGGAGRGTVGRGGSSVTGRGGGRSSAVAKEEGSSEMSSETLENPLVALECFIFV